MRKIENYIKLVLGVFFFASGIILVFTIRFENPGVSLEEIVLNHGKSLLVIIAIMFYGLALVFRKKLP